jgi:hypothetical protein
VARFCVDPSERALNRGGCFGGTLRAQQMEGVFHRLQKIFVHFHDGLRWLALVSVGFALVCPAACASE